MNQRALSSFVSISILVLGAICHSFAAETNAPVTTTNRPAVTRFPHPDVHYQHGPDSERKKGVPRGRIISFDWMESKVFPETIRRCALYVPAQYRSNSP